MSLTPELFDAWVTALRSGEYAQGSGQLKSDRGEFCCLGVLCDVAGLDLEQENPHRPGTKLGQTGGLEVKRVAPWPLTRLGQKTRVGLALRNDEGLSFDDIADHLDAHRAMYVEATS